MASWEQGYVKFANTEKRVEELSGTISEILESGRLLQKEALALRGRMQFANTQLRGISEKLCLNAVTAHPYGGGSGELCFSST